MVPCFWQQGGPIGLASDTYVGTQSDMSVIASAIFIASSNDSEAIALDNLFDEIARTKNLASLTSALHALWV